MNDATYFLTSAGEHEGIRSPRACRPIARCHDGVRDDYMAVEVTPPVEGLRFGLQEDIRHLLLSSRLEGASLYPIHLWPIPVYVAQILDPALLRGGRFTANQVKLVAWGMLFKSEFDAKDWASHQR